MLFYGKKESHPILDGKALVNVRLKSSSRQANWMEKLSGRIKHYLVNRQAGAYYYDGLIEDVPVVHLRKTVEITEPGESDFELNLSKDSLSFLSKAGITFGSFVSAGLLLFAAWGFGEKISEKMPASSDSTVNVSRQYSDGTSQKPPVIMAGSEKEALLLSSVMNPSDVEQRADRHRFTVNESIDPTHTNNTSTIDVHTNVTSTTHGNTVGPAHLNTSHSNTLSHGNTSEPGGGDQHGNTIVNHSNASDEW